jgi:AraC family transcriptional regulator of adaptative response / DNA-3-methyladenine glycosylase II
MTPAVPELSLYFIGPLDWDAMLAYFALRAIPGVEHVDETTYRRTITVDGRPGVVEISSGGDDHLSLRALVPSGVDVGRVVERARRIFALDTDCTDAVEHLSHDAVTGPLVRRRPGLRVPGTWDPFELGVRAIIGQQVTVAGASTITGRGVQRLGSLAVDGTPALTHSFPTAAVVAEADLDGLGLTGARITAIRGFARAVSEGHLRLDGTVPLEEMIAAITALPGLGPWTASYLALRLGYRDAFPAADLGLQRAVDPSGATRTAALTKRAEAWRPWRALAAVHLWNADGAADQSSATK